MQSWCRTQPPTGSSHIRAKQKTSQETQRSLQKFLPNVIYTDNSLNLAKPVKIFPGIIVRQHHTDRKQMGLLKEQCAEWKKAPLLYCCNQVWMKIGGRIPWNVIPICETFRISCLMGKHPIWETFWETIWRTYYSFWFTCWVLPYLCERPVKNLSIWKESLTWSVPWIRSVRGENSEGWHIGSRHWGVGNDGRIRNLLEKTQCKGSNISQRKWKIHFSSRRWTNQTFWRRSGTENTHLDTGAPTSRRKSKGFSWRIRRVSSTTSRFTSGCRWSDKWLLVHVRKLHIPPSRCTQSQTLLAERRIIPYSTEVRWRFQNYTHEFGCQAGETHRWLLEYRWIKRFVWFLDRFHSIYSIRWETSRRIYVIRWETDKTASDIQARIFVARTLDEIGKKC